MTGAVNKGGGAAWTPGPWVAPEGPFVGGHYVHTANNDADICEMPGWPREHWHEEEANAHLIAAAPELYEAAQAFVDAGNMSVFDGGSDKALADAFAKAEAALRKARGEA